jgi:hypothetical protein
MNGEQHSELRCAVLLRDFIVRQAQDIRLRQHMQVDSPAAAAAAVLQGLGSPNPLSYWPRQKPAQNQKTGNYMGVLYCCVTS